MRRLPYLPRREEWLCRGEIWDTKTFHQGRSIFHWGSQFPVSDLSFSYFYLFPFIFCLVSDSRLRLHILLTFFSLFCLVMISVYRLNIKITRSRNPSLNPARETFCSLCSQNGYSLPQATITIPFVRFCYAKPSKFEIPKFSPSLSPLVSPSPSQTLAGLSHSLSVSLSLSLSPSPHLPVTPSPPLSSSLFAPCSMLLFFSGVTKI